MTIPEAKPIYSEKELPVFVARQADLIKFNNHWRKIAEEFSIIKIANMPGIGKTELVKQFFRTFGMHERKNGERALLIYINCKVISDDINRIQNINDAYKLTDKMINVVLPQLEWYYEQINEEFPVELKNLIDKNKSETFWSFMSEVFTTGILKDKFKLFFFDEIQILYGKGVESILSERKLINVENWIINNPGVEEDESNCEPATLLESVKYYKQGAFRELSYLMSKLISPYTLIFVSGTQYSLLNSLGDLGSPVQGRVTTHNLSRLTAKESREWIDKTILRINNKITNNIWDNVCDTVIQLSGGIPRILRVYISIIEDTGYENTIKIFSDNFKKQEQNLIKSANEILDEHYISLRINKLFKRFGENNIKRLLSRIARHFMFHDYSTEEEITAWINFLEWKYVPHVSDLVEAGLMLKGNGNVVEDYSYHHSEQYLPDNPIVLVSKHIHNLLRKKFIDNIWLNEMGIKINEDTLNLLKISAYVVGFAFEYYFSLKIMELSRTGLELINNKTSPYFCNIDRVNLIIEDLTITSLKHLDSYVSITAINEIKNNYMYLLSSTYAIDGIITLDDINILYQCKFTKNKPTFDKLFYENFENQVKLLKNRTNKPVIKILFTYTKPTDPAIKILSDHNILINSDLNLLLGNKMIKWLVNAKRSQIKI